MNIDNLSPEIYEALADTQIVLLQADNLNLYDSVPAGHLILNAPRPLPGHIHTQGDFRHGVFYSFIDPLQYDAMHLIQGAKHLDGWVVVLGTAAELDEIAIASFSAKSPNYYAMYEQIQQKDLKYGTNRAAQIRFESLQLMYGKPLSSIIQLRTAP